MGWGGRARFSGRSGGFKALAQRAPPRLPARLACSHSPPSRPTMLTHPSKHTRVAAPPRACAAVQVEPTGQAAAARAAASAGAGAARGGKYVGVAQALRTIVREEGVRALWRGNLPAQMMVMPYCAVQFLVNRKCKVRATTLKMWRTKRLRSDFAAVGALPCLPPPPLSAAARRAGGNDKPASR